jgi:hypothetical protein
VTDTIPRSRRAVLAALRATAAAVASALGQPFVVPAAGNHPVRSGNTQAEATADRSARRMPSGLAAGALGGILALALAGCGGAATPVPAAAASPAAATAGAASRGSGSSGGTGAMPKDVCALLSAGELQSATGITFDAGKSVAVTGGLGCEWDAKAGLVSVNVFNLDHAQFVFTRDHLHASPVPGVGDEAWAGGLSPALSAAKGPLEIDVQVVAFGVPTDVIAAETALAKLVVSRL